MLNVLNHTQPTETMKQLSLFALCLGLPLALAAQQAVFTDYFTNSTTNKTSTPGGTPTASYTSYDMASTKTVTNSPANAGHLRIGLGGATTGGFYELQAVFASSPVSLVAMGDYINLTYTFTNSTGTLLAGGVGSYFFNGLYYSSNSVPLAGNLTIAGLVSAVGSPYASGNCANWQGYVSRLSAGGGSQAYTRPAQTNFVGGAASDQDLVGNNIGSGTYTNLAGIILDTTETNSSFSLSSGATYTVSYTIALTDAGTLTVTNNLYSGAAATGTPIFSQTNRVEATNVLTTQFDGLAIGVRNSGTSYNPIMDLASITVSASIYGSPGPSFNVTGGGAGCSGDGFVVGLNGSVATNAYLLYTNGVYCGQTISGTGSAISFGMQYVLGTYTVLASNTVNAYTGLMNGSALISLLPAPTIVTQPSAVSVAANSVGLFTVGASGSSVYYQWYRDGVGLANGGHFAGVTTSNLFVYPATATEVGGYYCVLSNACGSTTITTTNSLALDSAANLVWQGSAANSNWDVAVTANFSRSGTASVFHNGDNVTVDDTLVSPVIGLKGYVAPGTVTVSSGQSVFFTGSQLAGPGSVSMTGSGTLVISNINSYGGGTTLNGSGILKAQSYGALGTGVVTMVSGTLELPVAGSATLGLTNSINVTGNSTLQYDASGTYGAVVYGGISSSSSAATLGISLYNGNTATCRLRLYGAATNNAAVSITTLGAMAEIAPYNASGNQVYNGVISGSGRFAPRGAGNVIFNAANTFSDGTYGVILSGGNMGLGADSTYSTAPSIASSPVGTGILAIDSSLGNASIFANGAAHTVANPVEYLASTNTMVLAFSGSNDLTLAGDFQLALASDPYGTNRTFDVSNTGVTTLAGVISDNSLGAGITKTGAGVLCLNGVNTYTGSTTNTAGFLMGAGTIAGPVVVVSNAVLGAGSPTVIGTLKVNNNLTLGGNLLFKVNKSISPSNDVIVVSGILTNIGVGTLTVSNLGAAIAVGDKFTFFSGAVSNGAAITVTGAGMNWTNLLAVDGSIQALSVVSTTASYPTNVSFSFTGNMLNIGWPATHQGWIIQVQTNQLGAGLSTASNAWHDVTSTGSGTNYSLTVSPTNSSVYFRLRHP